jgi:hypothetical protein
MASSITTITGIKKIIPDLWSFVCLLTVRGASFVASSQQTPPSKGQQLLACRISRSYILQAEKTRLIAPD